MPKNELLLDEETHRYTLDGRRLIGVTEALSILNDRYKVDPFYLLRGSYVHKATELLDRDELDWASVDPLISGYVAAYCKFKADTGFSPINIEEPMFHPKMMYAGKPDRTGPLNGKNVLIDLKSGVKSRVDKLQGAAYWELCRANEIWIDCVFDLYLDADGTYKLEPIEKPKLLLPIFLAALTLTRFKEGL